VIRRNQQAMRSMSMGKFTRAYEKTNNRISVADNSL
jgi:hypothetical protein